MPETHIQDFPDAGTVLPTDLLNIQRMGLGVWNNYAMPAQAIIGQQLVIVTGDIQDIISGGVQVLPAPATGTMNLPIWGYLHYTPGSQFDGSLFVVEIDDGGTSAVLGQASFNFGVTKAAGPLAATQEHYVATSSPAPGALVMACLGSTLADGTITCYLLYENVFI